MGFCDGDALTARSSSIFIMHVHISVMRAMPMISHSISLTKKYRVDPSMNLKTGSYGLRIVHNLRVTVLEYSEFGLQ